MTSTPTNGNKSFPFAVNCRISKTFFGVPRKCSTCGQMIVLTAGFHCQFCRFRCHRKCLSRGERSSPRLQLCSLSQLPEGDDALFGKLLRENEINANDVDVFSDDWATVLAAASTQPPALTPRPASLPASRPRSSCTSPLPPPEHGSASVLDIRSLPEASRVQRQLPVQLPSQPSGDGSLDSLRTLTSAEGPNAPPPVSPKAASPPPPDSVMERFLRLLPWNRGSAAQTGVESSQRSLEIGRLSSGCPSSPSGLVTPVDEFNQSYLEELFQARSNSSVASSSSVLFSRRRYWVRCFTGDRSAQSQDCVAGPPLFPSATLSPSPLGDFPQAPPSPASLAGGFPAPLRRSSTWPLSGLHLNHEEEEEEQACLLDIDTDSDTESSRPLNLRSASERLIELGEWSIPSEELEYGEVSVEGRSVSTFAGQWHGDVMIHQYHQSCPHPESEPEAYLLRFLHEVHTLTKIRHENIALFMGACVEPPKLAVVTARRKGDALFQALHIKDRRLSHHSRLNVARQIAQGMGYLHAKGIVLKCLSSRSVFLECKVKICMVDYEGPKPAAEHPPQSAGAALRGQLSYLAPELLRTLSECSEEVEWQASMKALLGECWSPEPGARPKFSDILRRLQQTVSLARCQSSSEPEKLARLGRSRRVGRSHHYPPLYKT